jgi:hypothetical protein
LHSSASSAPRKASSLSGRRDLNSRPRAPKAAWVKPGFRLNHREFHGVDRQRASYEGKLRDSLCGPQYHRCQRALNSTMEGAGRI